MVNFIFKIKITPILPILVENLCKTTCKTVCKFRVFFRVKLSNLQFRRAKLALSTHFSHFFRYVFPHIFSLLPTNLFHYSTEPITTITKYNIERKI